MKLLVVTQIFHSVFDKDIYAYGPYSKEMNLWFQYFDEIHIISPINHVDKLNPIEIKLNSKYIVIHEVPDFNTTSILSILKSIFFLPYIFFKILGLMYNSDHIHLRCPGNMGLLGSIAQILYPFKKKTAKYAGNWDFNSKQPFSYRLQQLILRSTFFSHNIKVLVYGDWPGQSKNILPFFTASYHENQIELDQGKRSVLPSGRINLIYVGALESNKNPMICIELAKKLKECGHFFQFDFFGEGSQFEKLVKKSNDLGLDHCVTFHGNVDGQTLIGFFKKSHFLVFLSDSEGWPKVVAESMFWGCVPLTSAVSCVPQMVNYGQRGILVSKNIEKLYLEIHELIHDPERLERISQAAQAWSSNFTLEKFEKGIKGLI